MALSERLPLYRALEAQRKRPLIVYSTSPRQGPLAGGQIAGDTIAELLQQLQALPPEAPALDFLIVSKGGDPTVAWRIVSLIRERVQTFSVLVPESAFSAATLVALGADEIVMHPYGNLGPVDPQIPTVQKATEDGSQSESFSSQDLAAFLTFAREEVGLTDQDKLLDVFRLFCSDVSAVKIGVAARSARLMLSMGEQLLKLHMRDQSEAPKALAIAEALNKKFHHHGYPLSRKEAKQIGLKIVEPPATVEDLLWRIWLDIMEELEVREPFSPISIVKRNPDSAPLFAPATQVNIPSNLPPQLMQQILQAVLQQVQLVSVPPSPYAIIHSILESTRCATRFISEGNVFASRLPNLQLQVNVIQEHAAWKTLAIEPEGKPGEQK
jgi:hypothetical protein